MEIPCVLTKTFFVLEGNTYTPWYSNILALNPRYFSRSVNYFLTVKKVRLKLNQKINDPNTTAIVRSTQSNTMFHGNNGNSQSQSLVYLTVPNSPLPIGCFVRPIIPYCPPVQQITDPIYSLFESSTVCGLRVRRTMKIHEPKFDPSKFRV